MSEGRGTYIRAHNWALYVQLRGNDFYSETQMKVVYIRGRLIYSAIICLPSVIFKHKYFICAMKYLIFMLRLARNWNMLSLSLECPHTEISAGNYYHTINISLFGGHSSEEYRWNRSTLFYRSSSRCRWAKRVQEAIFTENVKEWKYEPGSGSGM